MLQTNKTIMMNYVYGYGGPVGGFGLLSSLICLVIFIDLVLVGIWLWKQINKNNH